MNSPPKDRRNWMLLAIMIVVTLVAYIPAMRGGFIWDDDQYIQANVQLRTVAGLSKIWLQIGSIAQYYPLTFTTFWLEYHLWGMTPTAFHIDNVLLHLTSAVILWGLLRKLSIGGAWFIAMIFAVHPMQVESVAWAMERKNVLSGLLFLLSLRAYLKAFPLDAEEPGPRRFYWASLALFVLALLSKSVASSLPAVVLVLMWWKRGRLRIRDFWPLIPFFMLGIGMGSLTGWMERHLVGAVGPDYEFTFSERLVIAGRAIWFYVVKIVWPAKLTFIYPRWIVDPSHRRWLFLFPLMAAIVVIALWICRRRISRGPLAAVLLFGGMMFPALGFVSIYPMKYSFVADHFQYLAGVALVTLFVATAMRVLPKLMQQICVPFILLVLAALTWRQGEIYKNVETLWTDTLTKNDASVIAHANCAAILMVQGRYDDAENQLHKVISLDPTHVRARLNLGLIAMQRGDLPKAIEWFSDALRQVPNSDDPILTGLKYDPYFNLGVAYSSFDREKSEQYYQLAIESDPKQEQAHTKLGDLFAAAGERDHAIQQYRTAIECDPNSVLAHLHLANLLAGDDGAKELDVAGDLFHQAGDLKNALACYSRALQLDPSLLSARDKLSAASEELLKSQAR